MARPVFPIQGAPTCFECPSCVCGTPGPTAGRPAPSASRLHSLIPSSCRLPRAPFFACRCRLAAAARRPGPHPSAVASKTPSLHFLAPPIDIPPLASRATSRRANPTPSRHWVPWCKAQSQRVSDWESSGLWSRRGRSSTTGSFVDVVIEVSAQPKANHARAQPWRPGPPWAARA